MFDHDLATTLMLTLEPSTLNRAARLGGLPIALDERLIDDETLNDELVRFFAKRGIETAIHEGFERLYPPRYPEDCEVEYGGTRGTANADVASIWRGQASW